MRDALELLGIIVGVSLLVVLGLGAGVCFVVGAYLALGWLLGAYFGAVGGGAVWAYHFVLHLWGLHQ